jgi:hypothetical protein
LSVPNQCSDDIGIQTSPTISPSGCGAISGAKIAVNTNSAVRNRPIAAPIGMRRTLRRGAVATLILDA